MAKKNRKRRESPTLKERRRILRHVRNLKDFLGDGYLPLVNRIKGGEDPADPDYMRDRWFP